MSSGDIWLALLLLLGHSPGFDLLHTNIRQQNITWTLESRDNMTIRLLQGGGACGGILTKDKNTNDTCVRSNRNTNGVNNCTYLFVIEQYSEAVSNGSNERYTQSFECESRLTDLNVSNTNLTAISDNVFADFTSVEVLDLSSNLLTNIGHLAFHGLVCLQELYLNNNQIDRIYKGLFEALHNLELLDVSDNRIVSLNRHTFSHLQSLHTLYFRGNQLSEPTLDFLQPLVSVYHIDLSRNKFTHLGRNAVLGSTVTFFVLTSTPTLSYIVKNAFVNCNSVAEVDLSDNVNLSYIDDNSFEAPASNLTLIITNTNIRMLNTISNKTYVIFNGRNVDRTTCFPATIVTASINTRHVTSAIESNMTLDDEQCGPSIVAGNVGNISVFVGDRAHAECYATGRPSPYISWQRLATTNVTQAMYNPISEGNTFSVKVTSLNFAGNYSCCATSGSKMACKSFYVHVNHTDIKLRVIASNSRAIVVTWNKKYHVAHHIVLYRAYEQTSIYTTQHISEYWKIFRINSLSPDTHYEICIASYSDVNDRTCVRSPTTREYQLTPGIHHNVLAITMLVITGLVFTVFLVFTVYKCCRKIQVIANSNVFVVGATSRVTLGEVTETTFLYENQYTELDGRADT